MKKFFSLLAALVAAITVSAGNLPKVTLTLSGTITGDDWTAGCALNYNGTSYTNVSVEYSGSEAKKNYRIKLDKKKAVIGSEKYKQWMLLSGSDDVTKMRNALADEVSKAVGMEYTPQYQFVDLYVGTEYAGIYMLTDRVKAEAGRAMVGDGTGIDWLVELSEEGDVSASDAYVTGTSSMPYIVMKNPDPDDITAEQTAANISEMEKYFTSLFANPKDLVKQDQFVAWYIASEIICNYKGFTEQMAYRSTYGDDQLLRFGPIWDNEKGFNNNASHPVDMTDITKAGSYEGLMLKFADHKLMRKWLKALMENTNDTWFREAVWAKWQTLSGLKQTLTDKVSALEATLATSAVGYSLSAADKDALTTYITNRFDYLDTKFAELSGNNPTAITSVSPADESTATAIYSITGQRLSAKPQQGMFIVNGRKMIAK